MTHPPLLSLSWTFLLLALELPNPLRKKTLGTLEGPGGLEK